VIWQIKNCKKEGKATNTFITGGNDGLILVWSLGQKCHIKIDIRKLRNTKLDPVGKELGKLNPGVRGLDASKFLSSNSRILVGTRGSDVFEVDTDGILLNTIVQGHSPDTPYSKPEVWGLSCHPTENKFVTCGSDRTVRLWEKNELVMMSNQF
jgi:WD40 repeat protein